MSNWLFATPTTDEAPFAWNPLHERFRISRGITVKQVAPGANYVLERYGSYTDELGAENLPSTGNHPEFWPQPAEGLNVFRGGYEWIVDDQTRDDIINSGIGITASNFTLIP